jgi:hypothetical protein
MIHLNCMHSNRRLSTNRTLIFGRILRVKSSSRCSACAAFAIDFVCLPYCDTSQRIANQRVSPYLPLTTDLQHRQSSASSPWRRNLRQRRAQTQRDLICNLALRRRLARPAPPRHPGSRQQILLQCRFWQRPIRRLDLNLRSQKLRAQRQSNRPGKRKRSLWSNLWIHTRSRRP